VIGWGLCIALCVVVGALGGGGLGAGLGGGWGLKLGLVEIVHDIQTNRLESRPPLTKWREKFTLHKKKIKNRKELTAAVRAWPTLPNTMGTGSKAKEEQLLWDPGAKRGRGSWLPQRITMRGLLPAEFEIDLMPRGRH